MSDITALLDSYWAGNKETRKSTSGGVLKVGKHVIRTLSSTQPTVATSSGEAELLAMYDGATRGLGMQTVMTEMGLSPHLKMIRISTDSSVAKSFVATRGLGQMRHSEVEILWLQEIVQMGKMRVEKVSGATNIADALTKYHGVDKLDAPESPCRWVRREAHFRRAEGTCPKPLATTLVVAWRFTQATDRRWG